MKTLKNLILFLIVLAFAGCQSDEPASDEDAFAKYGQEFEGKIAKSYQESEEWWPSPPKPPAGTPNVVILLIGRYGLRSSFPVLGVYVKHQILTCWRMMVCDITTSTLPHFAHHPGQALWPEETIIELVLVPTHLQLWVFPGTMPLHPKAENQ